MSGVLPKRYKAVKELGRGGFGTVYLAQDLSADGSLVAIKVIDTRQVNPKYISQEVVVAYERTAYADRARAGDPQPAG